MATDSKLDMEIKEMKCEHNFKLNEANGHVVCLKCGDVYIPISKIDAKIKELEVTINDPSVTEYWRENRLALKMNLENLKK